MLDLTDPKLKTHKLIVHRKDQSVDDRPARNRQSHNVLLVLTASLCPIPTSIVSMGMPLQHLPLVATHLLRSSLRLPKVRVMNTLSLLWSMTEIAIQVLVSSVS